MPRFALFLIALLLATLPGCAWLRSFVPVNGPQAPRVLAEYPSLDQVTAAINANTARVQTYTSNAARISTPGLPALRANIAVAGQQQFRLRADTVLTGTEVDLGSNEHEFWFWTKRNQPPALYYSSHQAFAASSARSILPIEPTWLVEALGMPIFGPDAQHSGPRPLADGRLEIRSEVRRPSGDLIKITIVDGSRALIMEQHVYTAEGERIASAVAKRHRYDPLINVSLPTLVDVQIPRAQLNLSIDVSDYQVNRLAGDPQQLFARPQYDGVPAVDLATLVPPGAAPVSPAPPATNSATSRLPINRLPYAITQ